MPISPQKLKNILEKNGFIFSRQSGSHAIFKNTQKNLRVHNKDISKGTLNSILKDAQLEHLKKSTYKMHYPQQFFWNIESLWEKYFVAQDPKTDFSGLQKKYQNKNISVETLHATSLQKQDTQEKFILNKTPDFTPSTNTVFKDENQKNFGGLENYSLCFQGGKKPVYFFDNHHEALFPFYEIFLEHKNIPLTIVHIDAHRDDAVFPCSPVETLHATSLQKQDIQNIISQCRVSDYLDAGKKIGLIDEIISITQESEFENFPEILEKKLKNKKYILNLDIDIYGPEGTAVETELKTKTIANAWKNADAVCFATSPGFIDQTLAQKLGKIFY